MICTSWKTVETTTAFSVFCDLAEIQSGSGLEQTCGDILKNTRSYLSGYHADTPITIKAEPFIWPTAAFINIHEHPL